MPIRALMQLRTVSESSQFQILNTLHCVHNLEIKSVVKNNE